MGAERWIKDHPERLFLDSACTQPFPLSLPTPATATFHRILVAHGTSKACMKAFGGGSGSLTIAPSVVGPMHTQVGCQPFMIGQIDSKRGYVHVFDDTSLDIVMKTLNTITDFVMYLTKKERLIQNGQLVWAAGEEDLLAYYLKRINSDSEHDFIIPGGFNELLVEEGLWANFLQNPRRKAQIEADGVSYMWDRLIERLNCDILASPQYFTSSSSVQQAEKGMRFLARELRTRRRMLAYSLLSMLETRPFSMRRTRIIKPSRLGDPYYVFLLLPQRRGPSETQYREERRLMLEACCRITKGICPDAQDIVGIASETGSVLSEMRSEDMLYLNVRHWNDVYQSETEQLQRETGLLTNITVSFNGLEQEYPLVPPEPIPPMKGRKRNAPCPCGSRKKYKKCCG